MASRQQMAPRHAPHGGYAPNHAALPIAAAPPGTFAPGTKIQVGSHRVVIQKYLSEGGFAHVYLVRLPKPIDGTDLAVLKRVAVPDKEALRSMRTEVETMKRLKGHRPIVTYIDSHASELHGGGYEVFLLMEYCDGGGLIDFMNTRLQHRLTEPEIINIFADIAEGVACMHYLKPPLLHRDLKVENVLITSRGSHKRFKLCDFGSAAPPRPAPTTVVECRLADEDVQRHTTLQYRSPEMIDVYRKQPLNEKSDIWALGVLLYKLCYYTTPFEDQGQLAILNASYRCPSFPVFSDRLKKLIASMLRESMDARPTIYQVLKEACSMQNRDVPIHDIYTGKAAPPSQSREGSTAKPQAVGAVFTEPEHEKRQQVPNVVPMRRGRPSALEPAKAATKPSTKNGDPFAALDSKGSQAFETDDLSARFPTVDQFSLLLDQGAKFDFDSGIASPSPQPPAPSANLSQRLTERLADAAFVSPQASAVKASPVVRPDSAAPEASDRAVSSPPLARPASAAPPTRPTAELGRAQSIISNNPDLRAISSQATSRYVSKGTMTSDTSPERPTRQSQQDCERKRRPIKRLSSHQLLPSHSRQHSLSSQPSLEDNRGRGAGQDSVPSSGSPGLRPRPASTTFESSTLEFLREREASKAQSRPRPTSRVSKHRSASSLNAKAFCPDGQSRSPSANELLIDVNESDSDGAYDLGELGRPKRSSSTKASGSRNKLAGKFGHALKRFESTDAQTTSGSRDSSPAKTLDRRDLTPIAGSVATDGRSEDGLIDLDEQDATPEMRREIERRKLEEEERRVAAGQAEYRKRVAAGGGNSKPVPGPKKVGGAALAASIQSRVQSLLEEEQRPAQVTRTAKGYGKYSDAATAASMTDKPLPAVPKKPRSEAAAKRSGSTAAYAENASTIKSSGGPLAYKAPPSSSSSTAKPTAPRKPVHLNSFPPGVRPPSPAKREQREVAQREVLMAEEMGGQPVLEMTAQERDEYVENFAKRFPSLGTME
ncbi:hypothetical protein CDD82_97 [Ophiocordyceps australis]|uniref:non-specific serine/threonine protein kinase n=1 Tax=Ophiocordyceps australis TaxID=1399860 RepID=A0A2C5XE28_9HYPO|nr:hypothetical protein CDD82_97 [Ophiocordyceps australis]